MSDLGTLAAIDEPYIEPAYADDCIANVPDTIVDLFDGATERPLSTDAVVESTEEPIDHVVLIVIDGFGWNRYEDRRDEHRLLTACNERGDVRPITSTFPSETAAAMQTLLTGLQPVEHGLIGWFGLLPEQDRVVLPLVFATRDGRPLDEAFDVDVSAILDVTARPTLAERLADIGVEPTFCFPDGIANSPSSRHSCGNAERLSFDSIEHGMATVAERLTERNQPTMHFVYYPDVDVAAHRSGTTSPAYRAALDAGLDAIADRFVRSLDSAVAERTMAMFVADHGMIDTDPNRNVDLGAAEAIDLRASLAPNADGDPLYLAGSPRNVQLHLREPDSDDVSDALESAFSVKTFSRDDYRSRDLFGDRSAGSLFSRRAPDLLVTHETAGIWFDDGELDLIGMHGGLHPHEMIVPFGCCRVSDLRTGDLKPL